ncbi:alpha/beta hydrolase [Streptomyces litchfieldiae]|uniref:Alpha/beta hydrolase n=1 Tax=Streptomyces litchfieldiae TaxID=3075543 RepID=A0ABU2N3S5_9ACTN|nr:alpha/beta hydrolase [Streptomyces sp. DSM 44938]MDT0347364.1 alpha/beta hydrolase [Streptomyces sp. DSM 44938]
MHLRAALIRTSLNGTARVAPRLAGRWALSLFSHPMTRVAVRPAEEPVMRRADRGELVVNGKTAVVYRWGAGTRPVLLMHGWLSRASRFSPLIQALTERGYSPVAFDAPGHGDAGGRGTTILEYRDMARQLHAEHGRFAAVIGHSVGGMGAFFALRDEIGADRLITIGAPAEFGYLVDSFRATAGLGRWAGPELRRRIESDVFPGEHDIWARFSATYRPGQLTMPILVIHDESDDMVTIEQCRRVKAAHDGRADLLITRGLGHRRILAAPEVIEAVLDFVSATEPAARTPDSRP